MPHLAANAAASASRALLHWAAAFARFAAFWLARLETHLPNAFDFPPERKLNGGAPTAVSSALHCFCAAAESAGDGVDPATASAGTDRNAVNRTTISFRMDFSFLQAVPSTPPASRMFGGCKTHVKRRV